MLNKKTPGQLMFLGLNEHFQTPQQASTFLRRILFQNYKLFSFPLLLPQAWRHCFCFLKNITELFCIIQLYSILQCKILLRSLWFVIYSEKLRTAYRLHHFCLYQSGFYWGKWSIYHWVNTCTSLQMEEQLTSPKRYLTSLLETNSSNGNITWQ